MLSINRSRIVLSSILGAVLMLAGCASTGEDNTLPQIASEGTRAVEYKSLAQLAEKANAIVVAVPTGEEYEVPLPEGYGTEDSAPTPYVTMKVLKIISGEVSGETINVVSPGVDQNTGKQALASGGPYLLFLAPAMYGANDPAGGYVVVGGPAGAFESPTRATSATSFLRIDTASPSLPDQIDLGKASIPRVTKTEKQLLNEGP